MKLSLITQKESAISSNVSEQEAAKFFTSEDEMDGPVMMMGDKKANQDDIMDEIE